MITIKEFSMLCECNIQTLRYYDRIGLLKPARVDDWTGYRYYNKSQAFEFIKIKNLQAADFSISEIKELMNKSNQEIYEAFSVKIEEQRKKLQTIVNTQKSYLEETEKMKELVENVVEFMGGQLSDENMLNEFGLSADDAEKVVKTTREYLGKWVEASTNNKEGGDQNSSDIRLEIGDEVVEGMKNVAKRISELDLSDIETDITLTNSSNEEAESPLADDDYEEVWSCHGWNHVYEFIEDIPSLDNDQLYNLVFRLAGEKDTKTISFPLYMLSAMLIREGAFGETSKGVNMGCQVNKSEDGENHFALLKRK